MQSVKIENDFLQERGFETWSKYLKTGNSYRYSSFIENGLGFNFHFAKSIFDETKVIR